MSSVAVLFDGRKDAQLTWPDLRSPSSLGRFLYSEDGTRFLVKGIAYQEAGAVGVQTQANLDNVSAAELSAEEVVLPPFPVGR